MQDELTVWKKQGHEFKRVSEMTTAPRTWHVRIRDKDILIGRVQRENEVHLARIIEGKIPGSGAGSRERTLTAFSEIPGSESRRIRS